MPLTPEDVHKKTFTPVRLREGYDMGEVDQFLDEVEGELTRLQQENDDLRDKLASAATASPTFAPEAGQREEAAKQPPPAVPAVAAVAPLPTVKTVPEAAGAAARLLEIATQNADQLVSEATADADRILREAQGRSEALDADAKATAERVESDARARAEELDAETGERRKQMLGMLERDKESLSHELEDLRAFEREYRSRLKSYFESQLKALDGEGDGEVALSPSSDEETPRRLRELLGEDQQS